MTAGLVFCFTAAISVFAAGPDECGFCPVISKPSLILLDEPSEGIQPSIVQDIARTIVDLNRRTNVTIVFVEQNLDMIRAMAQRCYVMDKGRIVAALTPEDLDDRETVRRHLAV